VQGDLRRSVSSHLGKNYLWHICVKPRACTELKAAVKIAQAQQPSYSSIDAPAQDLPWAALQGGAGAALPMTKTRQS
jgi:hypothetical protein